jgi:hypothetical protein
MQQFYEDDSDFDPNDFIDDEVDKHGGGVSVTLRNIGRKAARLATGKNIRMLVNGEGPHLLTDNYTGPGTNLEEADKYGPTGPRDRASRDHDYAYQEIADDVKSGELVDDKEIMRKVHQADEVWKAAIKALPPAERGPMDSLSRFFIASKQVLERTLGRALYAGGFNGREDDWIRAVKALDPALQENIIAAVKLMFAAKRKLDAKLSITGGGRIRASEATQHFADFRTEKDIISFLREKLPLHVASDAFKLLENSIKNNTDNIRSVFLNLSKDAVLTLSREAMNNHNDADVEALRKERDDLNEIRKKLVTEARKSTGSRYSKMIPAQRRRVREEFNAQVESLNKRIASTNAMLLDVDNAPVWINDDDDDVPRDTKFSEQIRYLFEKNIPPPQPLPQPQPMPFIPEETQTPAPQTPVPASAPAPATVTPPRKPATPIPKPSTGKIAFVRKGLDADVALSGPNETFQEYLERIKKSDAGAWRVVRSNILNNWTTGNDPDTLAKGVGAKVKDIIRD